MKTWLLAQPESAGALMSGSGATVFAVLRENADAETLKAKVLAEFGPNIWCRAAETLRRTE